MKKYLLTFGLLAISNSAIAQSNTSSYTGTLIQPDKSYNQLAWEQSHPLPIKTRLDLLSGTDFVLVISYLPSEITSITCDSWTMLGINSWHGQNNFTIPSGPAVAIMNSHGFNGYCKGANSIIAHTDDGDFTGKLDRGPGNWEASTKLTFSK